MILLLDLSFGFYDEHFYWTQDKSLPLEALDELDYSFKCKIISKLISKSIELTNNLTDIFIINLDGSLFTGKSFNNFKTTPASLKKIKYFNSRDFGWSKESLTPENLCSDEYLSIWGVKLLNEINYQDVLLIGEYVTPLILSLTQKLNSFEIYLKHFFDYENNQAEYIKCEDPSSYLEFLNRFYGPITSKAYSFVSEDSTFQKFFYFYALGEENKSNPDKLFTSFLKFRYQKLKLQIIGDDEYFIGLYTKALRSCYGGVHPFDCSDGDYQLKEGKRGLIFYSVDKLTKSKRTDLVTEIYDGEYNKKPVFFVTSESFDIHHLPRMDKTYLPSAEEIRKYFPQLFFTMTLDKRMVVGHNNILLYMSIYQRLWRRDFLEGIFDSAKSLTALDQLLEKLLLNKTIKIDLHHPDFWYEFVQRFESTQMKAVDEIDEENKEPIELTFIYDETVDEDNWIITSNLFEEVRTISYDSLGTKIMAYLIEYPSCKKLDAIELREKIKSYYGREYKPQKKKAKGPTDLMKNAYNSMRGAVKYDLEKLFAQIEGKDQLVKRVLKCFNFSIKCYYKENANVNMILKFNDPSLLNYHPTN